MRPTVPWMGALLLGVVGMTLLPGCTHDPVPIPSDARTIDLAAFADPPADIGVPGRSPGAPEVVEVPAAEFEPPAISQSLVGVELPDGETFTRTTTAETALDPATQQVATTVTDRSSTHTLRVGRRWPVESLVGQINGQPVYADQFFQPLEARILATVAQNPEPQARAIVQQLVRESFTRYVNSELVIAEAQSRLTPEMQQGVFAWLREMQERTIAERGGSRSKAEQELMEAEGMSMDEWIDTIKNRELMMDLLRRRVEPRVLVSWRDIEQLYEKGRAQFAPEPTVELGRIMLNNRRDAEKIEQVKAMFAEGKSFAEVASFVRPGDMGAWMRVQIGPDGMDLGMLADRDLARAIAALKPGEVTGPLEGPTYTQWVAHLREHRAQAISIFDPALQLALRNQLQGQYSNIERNRYISKLRSRWLSDDIQKMEFRLQLIASERYFDRGVTGAR